MYFPLPPTPLPFSIKAGVKSVSVISLSNFCVFWECSDDTGYDTLVQARFVEGLTRFVEEVVALIRPTDTTGENEQALRLDWNLLIRADK